MFRPTRIKLLSNSAILASYRGLHSPYLQQPIAHRIIFSYGSHIPYGSHIQQFSTTYRLSHGNLTPPKPGEELHVTFILRDGSQRTFEVAEGDSLLDIAQANNLEMEGACGGSCACSTCHVIVDPDYFDALPEPSDDENDMLDLAYGLTETSRLGCQIKMSKDIDGLRVALPAMTRNVSASDFK